MTESTAIPFPTSTCKVVLASTIAKTFQEEIQSGLSQLPSSCPPPLLVGFLASTDPSAKVYADWTAKTCTENGFRYMLKTVEKDDIEEALIAANKDSDIAGIIVYYPIFPTRQQDQYLQSIVSPSKDVEALSHHYIFHMYQNDRFLPAPPSSSSSPSSSPHTPPPKLLLPCTPLAIIKILEYVHVYNPILAYGNRLHGKVISVINRSEVVGRPLAALLANDGARVYSIDITGCQLYTRGTGLKRRKHEVHELPASSNEASLKHCLASSDVVISGVPGDTYKVPVEYIKDGAVCINFSSERNFGPEVKERASIYVPAIGKVTIMILLRNLLRLVHNNNLLHGNQTTRQEESLNK